MKQHRDFVTYVRNGVEINALVAFSHDIYTPATQTVPAFTTENLTLVYLDPAMASTSIQTGEQLRSSIKTEYSVAPLVDGKVNGWKDVAPERIEGSPRTESGQKFGDASETIAKLRMNLDGANKYIDELRAAAAAKAKASDEQISEQEKEELAKKASAPVPES